jgi:N-acetylglucosamine-6-phosphate deacetylase
VEIVMYCNLKGFSRVEKHFQPDISNISINNGMVADPHLVMEADIDLHGGFLLPGLIDLQVNGGGGVLFNNDPTPQGLGLIVQAHRRLGTAGLLATVITDSPEVRRGATAAVCAQLQAGLPGLLGVHFEGPFINPAKAGVHHPRHIRAPSAAALTEIVDLARTVQAAGGVVLLTLAPELFEPADIAALAGQGLVLAAGHSLATYEQAMAGFAAGVRGVTHLFNAMSGPESRAPGLVGAALDHPDVWCGIIADGFHAHPAMLRLAARLKGPEKLVLVSDAMACAGAVCAGGTDAEALSFELYGQTIRSVGGRLLDADGRLAGADLCLAAALRNMVRRFGVSFSDAASMASAAPLAALGLQDRRGGFQPGMIADFTWLDAELTPRGVWSAGDFCACGALPLA